MTRIKYITDEQMAVVTDVHENYSDEFKAWAEENESELMKWYDENDTQKMGLFEIAMEFAYYCASRFMELKVR